MINWREKLIYITIIAILIIGLCFLGSSGEEPKPVEESETQPIAKPAEEETRLDVTVIDGMNDKLFKLENCKVAIMGKLHLVNDYFNYTKTFIEGDRYEITISIRKKI